MRLIAGLFLILPLCSEESQEFRKMLSVGSAVEIGADGEPSLKAGEFTIPEGFIGTNLRFEYLDPVSGEKDNKLRPFNIFDVERKKPIPIKGELKSIPPGKYRLKIKLSLGACATLVYDLEENISN